jgi:hypothetical protein
MSTKRLALFAMFFTLLVLTTSYTRPASALPRFGYETIYYEGFCSNIYEVGSDVRTCDGLRTTSGTLAGTFKYDYVYECRAGGTDEAQWYFYCDPPGGWSPVSSLCSVPC